MSPRSGLSPDNTNCRFCNHLIRANEAGLWIDTYGSDVCHSPKTDQTLHLPVSESKLTTKLQRSLNMPEQTEFDTIAFKNLLEGASTELLMGMWLCGYVAKQDDEQMARMLFTIIGRIQLKKHDKGAKLPDEMAQKLNLFAYELEKTWWPTEKKE